MTRTLLTDFLVWVLYPAWLVAGGADYLCHRSTDIERNSGLVESLLHVAQFACLALALALAVLMRLTVPIFAAMVVLVVVHSVLTLVDANYVEGRRRITPFEQQVHGFMDVIPLVAVALVGILHWQEMRDSPAMTLALRPGLGVRHKALLGGFLLLAGVLVLEELLRTLRARQRQDPSVTLSPTPISHR